MEIQKWEKELLELKNDVNAIRTEALKLKELIQKEKSQPK